MKSLQKVGSIGALVLALYFFLILLFVTVILPGQGFTTPESFNDPAKALASWTSSQILYLFNVLDVAFAVGLTLVVSALDGRVRRNESDTLRLSAAAGVVAIPLFLAAGMTAIIGTPQLASTYARNQASASAAYLGMNAVLGGLHFSSAFAFGWWLVLVNWNALKMSALPKPLCYVGLVFGAASILFFAVQLLAPVTLVLGLVWTPWLGMVLWREPTSMAAPGMAKT